MTKKSNDVTFTWAQLRFSIIGNLLSRPPSKGELQKELKILASRHYRHPKEDRWITFGVSTLERWYYKALNAEDPIEALTRKVRSDAGKPYAMNSKQMDALHEQYLNYPGWSYKLHADNLTVLIEENKEMGEAPSYATVSRRMKENGWYRKKNKRKLTTGQRKALERLEKMEVRSFEAEFVNALWHLDFHEGRRIVDVNGKWHTPVALCILDDRSRLCCHIQWYLNETAEALFHGLTQAFHKRGLPRSLMTDNGSAMISHEIKTGLMHAGIMHETTLAYSPYQNGKQEAFWDQLEGRLISMLVKVEPLTLSFLNQATQAWIEMEYNRSHHRDIHTSPLDRFLKGPNVSRPSKETDALRFAFTVKEYRTQRKSDGTISIKGKRFEIPNRFRHFPRLRIGYQTWDLRKAYIIDERHGNMLARIYPQDKLRNANAARRTLTPLTEYPSEVKISDPVPPLLRRLMADYAATGLPPAYIPKEELNES